MSAAFWLRYGAAIATVCAMLWILARLARRLRMRVTRENGDGLREIASLALTPSVSVHVVRAGECDFLVATGGSICALVQKSRDDVHDQRQNRGAVTERNQPMNHH
jgi:flagellar biogenesis protein FliO